MSQQSSRRKRVTIYDVAKTAGVAPSTVSRAFARPGRVNAETGQRIIEIAEQLGYRSQAITRVDNGTPTKVLGFIVADVTNPVYAHTMKGFQLEAEAHGYGVFLADSREDARSEQKILTRLQPLVDGFALASSRMSDSAIAQMAKTKPIVAVNRTISGLPSVIADTARGMRRGVEALAMLGHQRVTYISGPVASWADGVRWRAVSEACHELSLQLRRIGPGLPTVEGGVAAARSWLDYPTTAVIAYNDLMGIGFMKAVQARGFGVPDRVSVIGVDNSITSVLTTPTLSTLAAPASKIGMHAARMLIYSLHHRTKPSVDRMVVGMELFARESIAQRVDPKKSIKER